MPTIFFGMLLLLGIWLHRDYGVSWDEPTDHLNGLVSVKYIAGFLAPEKIQQDPTAQLIPSFAGYFDNDHGVLFEVPLTLLSYVFTHHDSRNYYFMRHLSIFLTFALGVWATYRVGSRWLGSWRWGLLAAGLLVLSPRIFAESFYNGKDILFLGVFALAMHTLFRLLERPTWGRAAWHGVATAAAIDVRILGILLPLYTLGALLVAATGAPARARSLAGVGGLYLLVTISATIIGWPFLWADPVGNFLLAFHKLSQYPWTFTNFYWGELLSMPQLPWHYLPVWIFITTPLPYSLLALVGAGASAGSLVQLGWARINTLSSQYALLILGWLLVPIIVIIVLHSAVYDTWRHVYFIYPALVLLAARGLQVVGQLARRPAAARSRVAQALLLVAGVATAHTALRMVRLHPFQNIYYSFLSAPTVERLFERDHWAVSFRQGLEWLLAHDSNPQVRVSVYWPFTHPFYNNSLILPAAQRQRLQYTKTGNRYFMATYRWHPQPYPDSLGKEVYSIRAEGIKILSIFDKEAP